MITNPSLLVVDDEEIYCEGCRRIFSRQGFRVEESHDADQGLRLATGKGYAAILLDVRMPTMDGMEFLEHLREKKPHVPVILMTGYPSVSSAASAVRLGASDYVTKPFTPEEITLAVRNLLGKGPADGGNTAREKVGWKASAGEVGFFERAWMQRGTGGTVRAGAQMPAAAAGSIEQWQMPRIGQPVAQGLPLAGWVDSDGIERTVPSPISGVVVALNDALPSDPSVWQRPIDESWIAEIAPTELDEELPACRPRQMILATADAGSPLAARLERLGCRVRTASRIAQLQAELARAPRAVVAIDDGSMGSAGLEVVRHLRTESPATRAIVLASPRDPRESAYRAGRIFYYAVEPVSDGELVEILASLYASAPPRNAKTGFVAREERPIRSIQITNRQGRRVALIAGDGRLRRHVGLGRMLEQKLLDRLFPKETTLGEPRSLAETIRKTAAGCDRAFLLVFADTGRLPGCLSVDGSRRITGELIGSAENVTPLVVQPDRSTNGLDELDYRTTEALAEHLVRRMASA